MSTFFIISGYSGAGKTSIVKEIIKRSNNKIMQVISCTTRNRRENEINGKDYWFITNDKFQKMKEKNMFFETNFVFNNWYGLSKDSVNYVLDKKRTPIFITDVNGGNSIKKLDVPFKKVFIFISVKDNNVLLERLEKRGDSKDSIKDRVSRVSLEQKFIKDYDYVIINDALEDSILELEHIIANNI